MTSNLTNNMINCLTVNSTKSNVKNNKDVVHVDMQMIITNARSDRRFHKLLGLCIKHNIHIFNQSDNVCTILSVDDLLRQCNERQKKLTKELSEKIAAISDTGITNDWLIDIDNVYIQYKKKFKEIEIIIYVLKNIFDDNILEKLCCVQKDDTDTQDLRVSKEECNISDGNKKNKKEKISKYIAIYSS